MGGRGAGNSGTAVSAGSGQAVLPSGVLGGADNDDALWLHPFTDHDGERKVLAWRSPNQVGEYVVLKPTTDSQALPWTAVGDEVAIYPEAGSRNLPPRVDFIDTDYLGLVDPETGGGLREGEEYSVEVMETAVAHHQGVSIFVSLLAVTGSQTSRENRVDT